MKIQESLRGNKEPIGFQAYCKARNCSEGSEHASQVLQRSNIRFFNALTAVSTMSAISHRTAAFTHHDGRDILAVAIRAAEESLEATVWLLDCSDLTWIQCLSATHPGNSSSSSACAVESLLFEPPSVQKGLSSGKFAVIASDRQQQQAWLSIYTAVTTPQGSGLQLRWYWTAWADLSSLHSGKPHHCAVTAAWSPLGGLLLADQVPEFM